MNTRIIINGRIEAIQEKEFEGQKSKSIQMIHRTDKKGYEVIKVKVLDENSMVKEGDIINIPIVLSTMNNQIFYTQSGKLEVIKG